MVEVWKGNRRIGSISHISEEDVRRQGYYEFSVDTGVPMLPRRVILRGARRGFGGTHDYYTWWVLDASGIADDILRRILTTQVEGALTTE